MLIVGFNAAENDIGERNDGGGACVVSERGLEACIAEERITRRKYEGGAKRSIPYVLESSGLSMKDVDCFALSFFSSEYSVPQKIIKKVAVGAGVPFQKVFLVPSHHLSHAYSAFSLSEFDRALVVVMDNEGSILGKRRSEDPWGNSMERCSYYVGSHDGLKLVHRDFVGPGNIGFGKLYNKVTRYLGFTNFHFAGKTMGLSALGDPERYSAVHAFKLGKHGGLVSVGRDTGDSFGDLKKLFSLQGENLIEPRGPNDVFRREHLDLAAFAQASIERHAISQIEHLSHIHKCRDICIAGGVGLNAVMNGMLLKSGRIRRLFVQPACLDQGQCIGNALYADHVLSGRPPTEMPPMQTVYGGKKYSISRSAIINILPAALYSVLELNDNFTMVAKLLSEGAVVGWFMGGAEFGPRALGHRSILCDPRSTSAKDYLNHCIKQREWFRPFAPVVHAHRASSYFDLPCPSPYMTIACNVVASKQRLIPAVTHYDGTARVQTVTRHQNAKLFELLSAFERRTGLPILLNTSFNGPGEPIVETPKEALKSFVDTHMDILVIEGLVVIRRDFVPRTSPESLRRSIRRK